jgi:hypothetical protein
MVISCLSVLVSGFGGACGMFPDVSGSAANNHEGDTVILAENASNTSKVTVQILSNGSQRQTVLAAPYTWGMYTYIHSVAPWASAPDGSAMKSPCAAAASAMHRKYGLECPERVSARPGQKTAGSGC